MIKKIIFFLLFLFSADILSSCKKYSEDDSVIHLRTVKGRLCKAWSGSAHMVISADGSISGNFAGKWELTDRKKTLFITTYSGKTFSFSIRKLACNALCL